MAQARVIPGEAAEIISPAHFPASLRDLHLAFRALFASADHRQACAHTEL